MIAKKLPCCPDHIAADKPSTEKTRLNLLDKREKKKKVVDNWLGTVCVAHHEGRRLLFKAVSLQMLSGFIELLIV